MTTLTQPARISSSFSIPAQVGPLLRFAPAAMGILALSALLRLWNIATPFESSDQVAMAYMVHHFFGLKWMLAHEYGPVLPVLQRAFAELLLWLGIPMSEATARLPVALASGAQVAITFPLLRRMGCRAGEALVGTLACALVPTLITDAHFPWANNTMWLLLGTCALWATLSYLDTRRARYLLIAAVATGLHCLSALYAFALPLTIGAVWLTHARKHRREIGTARRYLRPALLAYVMPCLAALVVIAALYLYTGGGQLGRLIGKNDIHAYGFQWRQLMKFPSMWFSQFGVAFGILALGGVMVGLRQLRQGDRRGWLAFWALNGLWPYTLVANWNCTGFPQYYLFEVTYTAGVLGGLLLWYMLREKRFLRVAGAALGTVALIQLVAAGADICSPGNSLRSISGVKTGWGDVMPDTGIKACGWYVREHVPMNAVILALHDRAGMEAPIAEYYLGRRVLATYDLRAEEIPPLVAAWHQAADVIIMPASDAPLMETVDGFGLTATIYHEGRPVRCVYARPSLNLPAGIGLTSMLNPAYDRRYRPRHVPLPLDSAPGFESKLKAFQDFVRDMKRQRANDPLRRD